jgi:hypothetical protein
VENNVDDTLKGVDGGKGQSDMLGRSEWNSATSPRRGGRQRCDMGVIVRQDNKHCKRKEEGEKIKPKLYKEDNSIALRIGTWNKSYHWRDMFADKRQDIEIALKTQTRESLVRQKIYGRKINNGYY